MEYKIIEECYHWELTKVVLSHIREGWKPLGGVSTTTQLSGSCRYTQALVRVEDSAVDKNSCDG